MKPIRDAIGRTMLTPALRLMRAQMKLISDPVRLRELAAKVDGLAGAVLDAKIDTVSAGGVPSRWVRPRGDSSDGVLLYLHGGAFVAETPRFHGALLARLCTEAGTLGLMPSYRLAPEHPYPAALDDCLAAYRWLLVQGHDPAHIVVAGDSAGGNLTLALLLRARDEGLPLPAGAVAISPVADLTFSGDSVRRNDGIDDMFSADLMDALVPVYLRDPAQRHHPHVSPLFGNPAGLPPLLLLAGSTELLLDDSVRVAQRWPDAKLLVWHDMPHVFPGFDFLPEAREAVEKIVGFVRNLLAAARLSPEAAAAPMGVAAAEARTAQPTAAQPTAVQVRSTGQAQVAGGPEASPAHPSDLHTAYPATHPTGSSARPGGLSTVALAYFVAALLSGLLTAVLLAWPGAPRWVWSHPLLWAATAAVVWFVWAERASIGNRRWPWCGLATIVLGPACGLMLFLALRALRGANPAAG